MMTSVNYLSAKEAKEKVEKMRRVNKEIYRIRKLIKFSALTGKNCITTSIKLFDECTDVLIEHFKKYGFDIIKDADTDEVRIRWDHPSDTKMEDNIPSYRRAVFDRDIKPMTAKYAHRLYLTYTDNDHMFKLSLNQIFDKINEATDDEFLQVTIDCRHVNVDSYVLFVLDYLGYKVETYLKYEEDPHIVIEWR